MYHFLVADDHPLFRQALLGVINSRFPEAEIIESEDLDTTLKILDQRKDFDLLLLDLHMPGSEDLFGLISVREHYPAVPVVVVSASEDPSTISQSIGYGAAGYIPKSSSRKDIADAIAAVLDGESWIPEGMKSRLTPLSSEDKSLAAKISALTPQQYKVLSYLREGWLNKQIAYELGITEATVKAHITAVLRKLEVSNRTQAVVAVQHLALQVQSD